VTTAEQLQAIRAKCKALLTIWNDKRDHNPIYQAACGKESEAGWRATIAAIDGLAKDKTLETQGKRSAIAGILYAWSHLFPNK
jgi:hypothetical protein